jgi:hypothetical protein
MKMWIHHRATGNTEEVNGLVLCGLCVSVVISLFHADRLALARRRLWVGDNDLRRR